MLEPDFQNNILICTLESLLGHFLCWYFCFEGCHNNASFEEEVLVVNCKENKKTKNTPIRIEDSPSV